MQSYIIWLDSDFRILAQVMWSIITTHAVVNFVFVLEGLGSNLHTCKSTYHISSHFQLPHWEWARAWGYVTIMLLQGSGFISLAWGMFLFKGVKGHFYYPVLTILCSPNNLDLRTFSLPFRFVLAVELHIPSLVPALELAIFTITAQ